MEAALIDNRVKELAEERGFESYVSQYREVTVPANGTREIAAYNEAYILIGDAEGLKISSDYGEYNQGNFAADEHRHEHGDQIVITNYTSRTQNVKFMQIINLI